MRAGRLGPAAVLLTATLLSACTATPEPTASPSATSAAALTATASATPYPSAASTLTSTPSPTAATCEPFGTVATSASAPDWYADLRGAPGDVLYGATMRVGTHACYDRWVFEFEGDADMPGWSVTPHDANQFLGDPSGEPIAPPLRGTASLDIAFAAWYDGTPLGLDPYDGPQRIVPASPVAIEEARILSGFEGISHVGIGLDAARPYRVTWLVDPGRLVVDVYTGEP